MTLQETLLDLAAKLNFYILVPICLAVVGFFISYLRNYQWPAQRLKKHLAKVIAQIRAIRFDHELSPEAFRSKLDEVFEQSLFKTQWQEYGQSLHTVRTQDEAAEIFTVHATVPAESCFSKESLVDLQINADFYRHLPGILTGIGIIGTFSGLVWGLHEFRPDPGQALESLPLLLQEVTSAFVGSGFAILAAIFITYKEKSMLNQCYRLVEDLNKEIDSLHGRGAGEEYLARLVKAAESTPVATRHLKEDFLADMSQLMLDMVERQINAQSAQNHMLSVQISESIRQALAEPMQKMSGIVLDVTRGQRDAVSDLLENLLVGFTSRLDSTFGQQMQGISRTLQKSSDTMSHVQDVMTQSMGGVQSAMTVSISGISEAGRMATEQMSSRLEESMSRSAALQEQMIQQQTEQQRQFTEVMEVAVRTVLTKVQGAMSGFAIERSQQGEQDQRRHEQLISSTQELYTGLSDSVDKLLGDIRSAGSKTAENISSMQQMAVQAVTGMKEGASVMREAAERFTAAGSSVSVVTGTLAQTAASLNLTAGSVRQAFEEYDKSRTNVQQYVAQMQSLLETVKHESGVSQKLVDDMERIVGSMTDVERHSKEYLDQVSEVLKQSFQEFGREMVGQVRNISAESNRQMGTSLNALSGTVESMISSVTKLRRAG